MACFDLPIHKNPLRTRGDVERARVSRVRLSLPPGVHRFVTLVTGAVPQA